jgi:GTPase SAR1 family protein
MSEPFKVAVAGPSRVGKTTLVTAILEDTRDMLSTTPVSVVAAEKTAILVRKQRMELRRAIAAGVFDAAALGGTQVMSRYDLLLQADGDLGIEVPFTILDYPGRWLNPENRTDIDTQQQWAACEEHIKHSIMLLLPIDAAVLMEAESPRQRAAVPDLLGIEDVEGIAENWAKSRLRAPDEPAVVILAPLKCEKYFDDNPGPGVSKEAERLSQEVAKIYHTVLQRIRRVTQGRDLRIVYAPIDTYGCIQLMEADWTENKDEPGQLQFTGRYRFRGNPPQIKVKGAATVMQELCKCIMEGEKRRTQTGMAGKQSQYRALIARREEDKGFFGSLRFLLGGEARRNKEGLRLTGRQIHDAERQLGQLEDAMDKLATMERDSRVQDW